MGVSVLTLLLSSLAKHRDGALRPKALPMLPWTVKVLLVTRPARLSVTTGVPLQEALTPTVKRAVAPPMTKACLYPWTACSSGRRILHSSFRAALWRELSGCTPCGHEPDQVLGCRSFLKLSARVSTPFRFFQPYKSEVTNGLLVERATGMYTNDIRSH